MFTASSQRIESSMTVWEARSRGFQSNSREKHKQLNMRWTDVVRFREKGRRRDCGWEICSAFHFSLYWVCNFCGILTLLLFTCLVWRLNLLNLEFSSKMMLSEFEFSQTWPLLCSDSYFCTWANFTTPLFFLKNAENYKYQAQTGNTINCDVNGFGLSSLLICRAPGWQRAPCK